MRACIVCLLLASAAPMFGEPSEFCSVTGKMGDKRYEFRASKAEILHTPIWKENAEYPPLSPRKAERIARRKMQELLGSGKELWRISNIAIHDTHFGAHFVYVVEFETPDESCVSCDFIRVLVLMDGTVPKPIVKPMS